MQSDATTILLVDPDPEFLVSAAERLRVASGETWQVSTAASGGEALSKLQARACSLIALDVNMPVLDGVQLLGLIQRRFPSIIKVVLTGEATAEQRTTCLAAGAELVLDKPTTTGGWGDLHAAFDSLLHAHREEGFRGVLRKVSLPDIIQLECLAAKSSVLEVIGTGRRGRIYIREGQIMHADLGGVVGVDALNSILCLPGGNFHLLPFEDPGQETIAGQWEFLLMEAARVRDEAGGEEPMMVVPEAGPVDLDSFNVFNLGPAEAMSVPVVAPAEPTPAASDTAPDTTTGMQPSVQETMICSLNGGVLYAWNCPDAPGRVSLLEFITRRAHLMSSALRLGSFERFECAEKGARCVVRLDEDRAMFVKVQAVPTGDAGALG
jgi:CheY-like chemotaxis protein